MKTEYRKFTKEYCFGLRLNQTLTPSVKAHSKAITIAQRRKHAEADYYHSQRRKNKKYKEMVLAFARALETINFIKDDNEN